MLLLALNMPGVADVACPGDGACWYSRTWTVMHLQQVMHSDLGLDAAADASAQLPEFSQMKEHCAEDM